MDIVRPCFVANTTPHRPKFNRPPRAVQLRFFFVSFIHIVSTRPPSRTGQWDLLLGLLPEAERVRVQSFLRENDRKLALGSRLLQRSLVSKASFFRRRRSAGRHGSEPRCSACIVVRLNLYPGILQVSRETSLSNIEDFAYRTPCILRLRSAQQSVRSKHRFNMASACAAR